jgi:hypothetical protein
LVQFRLSYQLHLSHLSHLVIQLHPSRQFVLLPQSRQWFLVHQLHLSH